MPLPKPGKTETQSDFVSRFMSDETARRDFPTEEQRLAVAHETWKRLTMAASDKRTRRKQRRQAGRALPDDLSIRCAAVDVAWLQAGESDAKSFAMTPAYSGGELVVAGYRYPVVAAISGIAFDRLPKIRLDHDPTKRVGHAERVEKVGDQLHVFGKISASSEASREVLDSAQNQFPWQSSVTLIPTSRVQFIAQGKTLRANGRTFAGPIYFVEETQLLEVSFVDIGGDREAAAQIAARRKNMELTKEFVAYVEDDLGLNLDDLEDKTVTALQAQFKQPAADDPDPGDPTPKELDTFREERAATIRATTAIEKVCTEYGNPQMQWEGEQLPIAAIAIEQGWTPEAAELACLRIDRQRDNAALKARRATAGTVNIHSVDRESIPGNDVISAALCINAQACPPERAAEEFGRKAVDKALKREFRNYGLHRLMYDVISANGDHYPAGSVDDGLIRAAFRADQAIMASGFSTISMAGSLSNLANKAMAEAFLGGDNILGRISTSRSVNDFKEATQYRMTGIGHLEKVGPTGEIKHMNLDEEPFANRAETYARMLGLSRETLINDDLGQFQQISSHFGRKSLMTLQRVGFTALLDNSDNFFSVGNSNVIPGNPVLDIAGLTAGVQVLDEQTDLDGDPINMGGTYLLVPPALKVTAQQLMRDTRVVGQGADAPPAPDSNPHAGRWVPESTTFIGGAGGITGGSDTGWYIIDTSNQQSVLEIAYLRGVQTPTIEQTESDFNSLGMQFRVFFDFGVAKLEPRAGAYSDGTAT